MFLRVQLKVQSMSDLSDLRQTIHPDNLFFSPACFRTISSAPAPTAMVARSREAASVSVIITFTLMFISELVSILKVTVFPNSVQGAMRPSGAGH